MEDQSTTTIDNDLASRLDTLSAKTGAVTVERFRVFLKDMPEKMSIVQLNQILNFASEQVGVWEAAFSFSPAHSPNLNAKAESEQWEQLWNAWSNMLLELAPEITDEVHRRHRLIVVKHSVETSLH